MARKTSKNSTKDVKKAAVKRTGAKVAKSRARKLGRRGDSKLLAGGNPQIAKAYGDAPVEAYIAAMPGCKRDIGRRLDTIIVRTVPGVRKAVKWNSPLYGADEKIGGGGWFLGIHCYAKFVKVAFFRGTSLRPTPPGESKQKEVRYVNIHEDDELNEGQFIAWVKQASELPGERI